MILQDLGKIPGRKIQEPLRILVGSWQEIQEVKRWVSSFAVTDDLTGSQKFLKGVYGCVSLLFNIRRK